MSEPTDTLYLVYAGGGVDLLISKDKVLVNNYSDSTDTYNAFEQTAQIVASHFGGEIKEISLPQEYYTIVEEMFEAIDYRSDTAPNNDDHIAVFIMDNGFVKEFE